MKSAQYNANFLGCGRLISPKNGQMHLTIGLQSDPQKEPEKALFSCNPGYYLMGPTTITCRDSSWEDKEPVCQRKSAARCNVIHYYYIQIFA